MNDGKQSPQKMPVRRSGKTIAFVAISILIPFLLLFLLEIALRAGHYGHDLGLFIEYPKDKNYLFLNPDASKKYFSNQKNATTGNIEPFKKVKDPNTLRIFVLGESTTIGYPYFHNGSFHRWLQYRLTHTFPDRNFEIVNIALTAVNSYTVLGFSKEVVNYEPDAVLIYTGHNEYYGALGVGSTEKIGGSRFLVNTILKLRELKIVQLVFNLMEGAVSAVAVKSPGSDGTRMQRMVADQQIPFESELYQRGVDQFRDNMDATLKIFSDNDIPVFISNLVSNDKDLKPFVSFPVDSTRFPGFSKNYQLGLSAVQSGENKAAIDYFKTADQAFGGHALCNYYLGQLSYAQGDFKKAASYFTKASDLDGLRFRAPSELNSVIGSLVGKYTNTHLVDTRASFERKSVHGIIGENLILEHVHPDLSGYALMSDAFYEALKMQKLIPAGSENEMSFASLMAKMPITKVDSLSGVYKVANLKNSWPFKTALQSATFKVESFEETTAYNLANRKIQWLDAMSQLYDFYIGNKQLEEARKTVENLILEFPAESEYYLKSAMLSGELKDETNAVFSFKKAFALAPSFDIARYIFVIYLKAGKPAEAIPYLDYAIANNTSRFDLSPVRNLAQQIIELQKQVEKDSSNVGVLNQIAQAYLKMDNKDAALSYVQKVLQLDPRNPEALSLLPRVKS